MMKRLKLASESEKTFKHSQQFVFYLLFMNHAKDFD